MQLTRTSNRVKITLKESINQRPRVLTLPLRGVYKGSFITRNKRFFKMHLPNLANTWDKLHIMRNMEYIA